MRTLIVTRKINDRLVLSIQEILNANGHGGATQVITFDVLEATLQEAPANLVIFAATGDSTRVSDFIQTVKNTSDVRVITVGPAEDSRFILRTLQYGADYFIDQEELTLELPRVLAKLNPNRTGVHSTGLLYAVISGTGGGGASTLAVNLAAVLAKKRGRCGLIDLHLNGGDLAALLDIKPAFTLRDVCDNERRMDRALLDKMLAKHPSGIQLLAAAPVEDSFGYQAPTAISNAIILCRSLFPETVIDMQDVDIVLHREVLQQANDVFCVVRATFTSLKRTKRLLEKLDRWEVNRNNVKLVLNYDGQPNALPMEDVEMALSMKISACVGDDPEAFNMATNTGTPVVLKFPERKVTQQLEQILLPPVAETTGLFKRMRGWFKNGAVHGVPATPQPAGPLPRIQERFV